jgi:putative hydrolase of the HAD superfamily
MRTKPPTVIRGVVFDLFHTLTGPESQWLGAVFTSDALGIDRRTWDRVLHFESRWRLAGEERDPFCILRRLADVVDPSIPDEMVRAAVDLRLHRFKTALDTIPRENLDVLHELRDRGLRLGLVSNADASEVLGWSECPLCGLFDVEVFSCEVGAVKPEAELFNSCLKRLGLDAKECLYVGDGGSDELHASKALGFRTVFISGVIAELWPERISERMAVAGHHITRLPELVAIVGELSSI